MKINDRVKTTPLFAKEFAEEFTGVITEIDVQRARMDNGEYHPTKICTVATVKTDTGNRIEIPIHWLMSVESGFK
jgi:hypothetical protein